MIIKKQPLPKAIFCGCGDIQLVVGAALRNPTMPLTAVNWCMQYQPSLPPVSVQVPDPMIIQFLAQRTRANRLKLHHRWELRHQSSRMSS